MNVPGEVVPSTVATADGKERGKGQSIMITWWKQMHWNGLVRGTIWKLSPVMSWMFIVFQSPDASGVQSISQGPPSLKTCPGLVVGAGSAKTTNAMDKTKAGKVPRENIVNKILRQGVLEKQKKKGEEEAKLEESVEQGNK